jgi:sugar phosphate permease
MAFAMLVGGYLSDRVPAHLLMVAGMALMAYSFAIMHNADSLTATVSVMWWIVIGRIGISIVTPALNMSVYASLPNHLLSQASGTSSFLRQLGGTFGVNMISVYLARQTSLHMQHISETQQAGNPQTLQMLEGLGPMLQQAGIDSSTEQSLAVWMLGSELYQQALTMGFQDAFVFSGVLAAAGLIPAWRMQKRQQKHTCNP